MVPFVSEDNERSEQPSPLSLSKRAHFTRVVTRSRSALLHCSLRMLLLSHGFGEPVLLGGGIEN